MLPFCCAGRVVLQVGMARFMQRNSLFCCLLRRCWQLAVAQAVARGGNADEQFLQNMICPRMGTAFPGGAAVGLRAASLTAALLRVTVGRRVLR